MTSDRIAFLNYYHIITVVIDSRMTDSPHYLIWCVLLGYYNLLFFQEIIFIVQDNTKYVSEQ